MNSNRNSTLGVPLDQSQLKSSGTIKDFQPIVNENGEVLCTITRPVESNNSADVSIDLSNLSNLNEEVTSNNNLLTVPIATVEKKVESLPLSASPKVASTGAANTSTVEVQPETVSDLIETVVEGASTV
jgi:hypothetical protein